MQNHLIFKLKQNIIKKNICIDIAIEQLQVCSEVQVGILGCISYNAAMHAHPAEAAKS